MPSFEKKIRVVHYCNQLSIGGTERTMEIFCRHLDRSRFEIFAVSRVHRPALLAKARIEIGAVFGLGSARGKKRLWSSMNARVPNFRSILGADHVLFAQNDLHLRALLLDLAPDILHVHYSGSPEPPISDSELMEKIPVTVTTNPFERQNTSPAHDRVKKILFVSKWLLEHRATWAARDPRAGVLYNPIEVACSDGSLREKLNIPADAFVVGRVGRADPGIHDPISLKAFQKIEDSKTYFLALSPPENMLREAKALGLRNFISLPASADATFLSRFYNTIDVLAHARRDGETFGCNIAEAMIHAKPVVSHLTSLMNAQQEVIGDAGYVCEQNDWHQYAECLRELKEDPIRRSELARKAQKRALELFEARALTKKLESVYLELLGSS